MTFQPLERFSILAEPMWTRHLCPFRKLFLCIPRTDLSAAKGFEGIVSSSSSSLSCAVRLVATLLKEFSGFRFPSDVPQGLSAAEASQHFRDSAFQCGIHVYTHAHLRLHQPEIKMAIVSLKTRSGLQMKSSVNSKYTAVRSTFR